MRKGNRKGVPKLEKTPPATKAGGGRDIFKTSPPPGSVCLAGRDDTRPRARQRELARLRRSRL